MKTLYSIHESLSTEEAQVLQAYVVPSRAQTSLPIESLLARGYLQKTKGSLFVTPEGLAALLDAVPVEELRQAGCTQSPE